MERTIATTVSLTREFGVGGRYDGEPVMYLWLAPLTRVLLGAHWLSQANATVSLSADSTCG